MDRFERLCYVAGGMFIGMATMMLLLGVPDEYPAAYILTWIWPLFLLFFGVKWHGRGPRWERMKKGHEAQSDENKADTARG